MTGERKIKDDSLGAAFEEYYRSGESGKHTLNQLMNALIVKMMGAQSVASIKKKVDDDKKSAGLNVSD